MNQPETKTSNKKTILLVEDDEYIRELIYKAIQENNIEVKIASNGNEAVRLIDQLKENLNLILLDIILPDKNGYEVLQYIKADPQASKIPVLVISNLGQQEEIDKAMKLGAKDYLVKAQSDIDDIVAKVKKYL